MDVRVGFAGRNALYDLAGWQAWRFRGQGVSPTRQYLGRLHTMAFRYTIKSMVADWMGHVRPL